MSEISILRRDERAGYQLRELYRRHGYTLYRMSKFEEYDLYVRNKSFLVSEHILTFTDTDGRLMALKPDVTLSIVKNSPDAPGATQKVCYNETVYRTSPAAAGYREIMQAGLECIGDLDAYTAGEVLALADESLALISGDHLLDISHMGVPPGCWRVFPRKSPTPFWRSWGGRTPPPSGISAPGGAFPGRQRTGWKPWPCSMGPLRRYCPGWRAWSKARPRRRRSGSWRTSAASWPPWAGPPISGWTSPSSTTCATTAA